MPAWLKRLNMRVRATLFGQRDDELQRELDLHLQLLEDEYLAQGMPAHQARQQARRDFGNPILIRESSHDLFSFRALEDLASDARSAVREMRRSMTFTVIVITSLAVGIGAATATFAIVDAIVLRKLPVYEPQRLVAFSTMQGKDWGTWSYAAFRRWQQMASGLYNVAASSDVTLDLKESTDEHAPQASVALVSPNYFQVIGANISMGRGFSRRESAIGTDVRVAVVSDAFWRRWFASDPFVLVRTIELRGLRYAVIGVTSRDFTGHTPGAPTDIWVPLAQQPALLPLSGRSALDERAGTELRWLKVMARLAPTVDRSRAATAALYARQWFVVEKAATLGQLSPEVVRDRRDGVTLVSAAQGDAAITTQFVQPLMILAGITALVLLVACTNFMNLMFARAEARRVEFIIRLALGGGRWRLLRQSAVECLGLSVIAGTLGLLFARWATIGALSRVNEVVPVDLTLDLNWRMISVTIACIATAALCGVWPCIKSARSALVSSTQQIAGVSRHGSASPATGRLILIAQLVMCAVLLVGAGLLLRTVVNLRTQDLGFDRSVQLIRTATVTPGESPQAARAAVEETMRQLATVPGVKAVGVVGSTLLDTSSYWVEGTQALTTDRGVVVGGAQWTFASVGPGFFEAVGMAFVRGGTFDAWFTGDLPNQVVVNQSLARFLFGGDDPIGRHILLNRKSPPQTIIGVVQDATQISPRRRSLGVVYQPLRRFENATLAVRSEAGVSPGLVRRQIESAPHPLRLSRMTTIADELDRAIARERLMSGISMFLAALVVAIGCVGLYALMSYEVARRDREIGVRLALGATGAQVMTLVLGESLRLVALALAVGIPSGIAASRLVSAQFYGVSAGDPWTLISVSLLLALVALAATFRPARAASRIDPLVLLRSE